MKLLIAIIIVAAALFAGASVRAADAENELRLSQAIDEALKNNPEIHVLQNRLQQRAREAINLPTSKIPSLTLKPGVCR